MKVICDMDEDIYVQEREQDEITYKVIIIGDPAIGKTSLIKKYVTHQFEKDYIPTVGVSISKQPVMLDVGGKKRLYIPDNIKAMILKSVKIKVKKR